MMASKQSDDTPLGASSGARSDNLDDEEQKAADSLMFLTDRDLQRVKFCLRDVVLTSAETSLTELLSVLKRRHVKDNETETALVRWVFESIYTRDLKSDLAYEVRDNDDAQSRSELVISLYQQLLVKLDCQLRDEDLQKMKFLIVDIVPMGVLEKITIPLELFEVLEHYGSLSRDDVSLAKWLVEKSPRKDLLTLIQKYSSLSTHKVPVAYGLRRLPPDFVERQGDVEDIKKLLQSKESAVGVVDSGKKRPTPRDRSLDRDVIGIRGMGGIGKTVLTQAVCWQLKEQRQVIWLTIGQMPDLLSLLNTLASVITGQQTSFSDQAMAQNFISEKTADKDCLLVLDDVWDVNHAAAFDVMNGTCQLLVTTRNADVIRGLRSSQIHKLGSLGKKQSRELLMKSARKQISDLAQEVRMLVEEILEECGGLPLALALVGSSLVDANPRSPVDWQDRRDGLKEADLEIIKSCFPADSYPYENLLAAIEISFNSLPEEMKERFLNFAIFPEDIEVPAYVLEMLWRLPGRKTRNCLSILERRSLLQSGTTEHCYMVHDILLDYARGRLRRDRNDPLALQHAHDNFLKHYKRKCQNAKWSSGPKNDAYFYHHLAFHLTEANKSEELENELLSYDWLNVKLIETDLSSLLADFRFLSEESLEKEEVKLLRSSLMLSSNIVSSCKDQLGGQLIGRLKAYTLNPRVNEILLQVRHTEVEHQGIVPLRWCLTPPGGPLLRTIDGRSSTILSIVVTPDVKRIITGGADSSVRVWDYETGKELHKMLGHTKMVYSIALSLNADILVSGSFDNTINVWDMDTLSEVATLSGHKDWVSGVLITPDSKKVVSSSYDATIKIWDLDHCTLEHTLKGHEGHVRGIAVTPDGRRLLSASQDKTVKVWNLGTLTLESTLQGHSDTVYCVCTSPDGRYAISGSGDTVVKVWDIERAAEVRSLIGHVSDIFAVAMTPDGSMVISAGDDTTVKIWMLESGEERASLQGHSESVRVVTVSPGGKAIITGSEDRTYKLWNIGSAPNHGAHLGHKQAVNDIAMSDDGEVCVTGSDDSSVKVWDCKSFSEVKSFSGHLGSVMAVALNPKHQVIASGSSDCTIKLWDLSILKERSTLEVHYHPVQALAFSADGELLVSGAKDNCVALWDCYRERCLLQLNAPIYDIIRVTFAGESVVVCNRKHSLWRKGISKVLACKQRNDAAATFPGINTRNSRNPGKVITEMPAYMSSQRDSSGTTFPGINAPDSMNTGKYTVEVLACKPSHSDDAQITNPGISTTSSKNTEALGVDDSCSRATSKLAVQPNGVNEATSERLRAAGEFRLHATTTSSLERIEISHLSRHDDATSVVEGPDSRSTPALMIRDGTRLLLGSATGKSPLRCLDVQTAMDIGLRVDDEEKSLVTAMDATSDGKVIFGTDHGRVVRIDIDAGTILQEYIPYEHDSSSDITTLTLTSSNEFFLVGYSTGDVALYSLLDGKATNKFNLRSGRPNYSCAVQEMGIAICDSNGGLCVLHAQGNKVISVKAHDKSANALAYNATADLLMSGSDDLLIKCWKISLSAEADLSCHEVFYIDTSFVCGVKTLAFTPDGASVVSASANNTICQWNLNTRSCVNKFKSSSFGANYIYAGKEHLVATFDDCTTVSWDINTGEVLNTIQGHCGRYQVAAILPQGDQVLSNGYHYALKQWNINEYQQRDNKTLCTYQHTSEITTVCVLPDGGHVITGSRDKIIRLWITGSGACVSEFHFEHIPRTISCGANGRVCVGLSNGQVCFMEVCL